MEEGEEKKGSRRGREEGKGGIRKGSGRGRERRR